MDSSAHPVYGNQYRVCPAGRHDRGIIVWAWSRQNARKKGAQQLGVKPDKVWVSEKNPASNDMPPQPRKAL
jgi:hypothetical protein